MSSRYAVKKIFKTLKSRKKLKFVQFLNIIKKNSKTGRKKIIKFKLFPVRPKCFDFVRKVERLKKHLREQFRVAYCFEKPLLY